MTRRKLIKNIDRQRVQEAIRNAERLTSGEICVSVAPLFWGSIEKAADKTFVRMGMTRTTHRNGVLFFVVPARRKFVVLGDRGIHEKVGQEFWHRVVNIVSEKFKEGDFTEGLVRGIEEVGHELAALFPHQADDRNELSDQIDFGGNCRG